MTKKRPEGDDAPRNRSESNLGNGESSLSISDLSPQPIKHIFVSHAGADREVAERLSNDLRDAGHETKVDTRELTLGTDSIAFMNDAIADAHTVIILYSQHSKSARWQQLEMNASLWNEVAQSGGTCIVIRLDDTDLPPLWGPKVYGKLTATHGLPYQKLIEDLCQVVLPAQSATSIVSTAFGCDIVAPYCWFQEMIVSESPVFAARQRFQFGKVTVLSGGNGSGKSAVCEWLTFLCGLDDASRWANARATPLDISLSYFSPEMQTARLRQCVPGQFLFFQNEMSVPFYPVPMAIVHLPQSFWRNEKPLDEIQRLSELLSVNCYLMCNLIESVKKQNAGEFDSLEIEDVDGGRLVQMYDKNIHGMVRFSQLSDSMRARLLLELCVARARVSARTTPTLLLAENLQTLDGGNLLRYAEYLSSHDFQTIITLLRTPVFEISTCFESVVLDGTCENVIIRQNVSK